MASSSSSSSENKRRRFRESDITTKCTINKPLLFQPCQVPEYLQHPFLMELNQRGLLDFVYCDNNEIKTIDQEAVSEARIYVKKDQLIKVFRSIKSITSHLQTRDYADELYHTWVTIHIKGVYHRQGGRNQITIMTLKGLVYYLIRETFRTSSIIKRYKALWHDVRCRRFAKTFLRGDYEEDADFREFMASVNA